MKWLCSFGNQRSWFVNAVISLVPLSIILGLFFGLSIFLASSILILSTTFFLTLSKPKTGQKTPLPNLKDNVGKKPLDHANKTIQEQPKQPQQQQQQELIVSSVSSDSLSESDCLDSSDYDGSISDEESLIEIALPSGHYVGHYGGYKDKKIPSDNNNYLLPQCIMELLAEINELNNIEEDNLIEIDISMGSIKSSRFEIEA